MRPGDAAPTTAPSSPPDGLIDIDNAAAGANLSSAHSRRLPSFTCATGEDRARKKWVGMFFYSSLDEAEGMPDAHPAGTASRATTCLFPVLLVPEARRDRHRPYTISGNVCGMRLVVSPSVLLALPGDRRVIARPPPAECRGCSPPQSGPSRDPAGRGRSWCSAEGDSRLQGKTVCKAEPGHFGGRDHDESIGVIALSFTRHSSTVNIGFVETNVIVDHVLAVRNGRPLMFRTLPRSYHMRIRFSAL